MTGQDVARALTGWPRCMWLVGPVSDPRECTAWIEKARAKGIAGASGRQIVGARCSNGHRQTRYLDEMPAELRT